MRFHIYFATNKSFHEARINTVFTVNNLGMTHRFITTVEIETDTIVDQVDAHEEVFTRMQAEFWSPNGEARSLIYDCGVGHTSMSGGDIIYNEETREFVQVMAFGGWKVLD